MEYSLEKNVSISSDRMVASDSVSFPRLDNPTGACPTHRRQWADFLVCRTCPVGLSKHGRDTEFDANIQLEEMLTFFSNEYKVCINIFSVFPRLCRVLSVITAEQIVTGDHA